jgi:hypothetical protein
MIAGASGGMKVLEGKNDLIKNGISRDIDAPFGDIQALKPIVHVAVTKKHTLSGMKLKFMRIIGT